MFESVDALIDEHRRVQEELSDPAVHADPARAKRVNRRYAELNRIVQAHQTWVSAGEDLDAARRARRKGRGVRRRSSLARGASRRVAGVAAPLLIPRDPDDARDVIMEIKAGEGGAESALFAADLLRMYLRVAGVEDPEMIESDHSDLGGYKNVQVAFKSSSNDPASGVSGAPEVRGRSAPRTASPATESRGASTRRRPECWSSPRWMSRMRSRSVRTTCKIDVYRSSGPGGRGEHHRLRRAHHARATGIVVSMQNEKSAAAEPQGAMRVLRARLLARQQEELHAAAADARKSHIRGMDRSERIRTYNFPENRIADHRTGYKAYNLDHVMDGALAPVVESVHRQRPSASPRSGSDGVVHEYRCARFGADIDGFALASAGCG